MSDSRLVRYAAFWVRWVFGAHALFSGLNYFFNFFPQPPITASPAWPFIHAMMTVGMYGLIKVVEVVTGMCLLLDVFVPLALVMEFPVSVGIFFLDAIVDGSPRPTIMGTREIVFNLLLMAAYAGYYLPMLKWRAMPRELWNPGALRLPRPEGSQ